jgi:hypothetical protein
MMVDLQWMHSCQIPLDDFIAKIIQMQLENFMMV